MPPGFPSPDLDTTSALLQCLLQKPGTAASSGSCLRSPGLQKTPVPLTPLLNAKVLGSAQPTPPPAQHAEVLTAFHPWFLTPNRSSVSKSRQFFRTHLALLPALMLNTRPKPGLTRLLWPSCMATPTPSHLPPAADLTVALHCARQLSGSSAPSVMGSPASSRPLHTIQATDVCELTRERLFAPARPPRAWQTQEAAGGCVTAQGRLPLEETLCSRGSGVAQGLSLRSRAKHLLLQRRRWTWKLYF